MSREAKKILFLLSCTVLVGFLLRIYGIGNRALWYDEVELWYYALTGLRGSHDGPMTGALGRIAMYWIRSADPIVLHLVSVLFGTAVIPAIYLLGSSIGGVRVGLLSAVMLALSPMGLYYSQEARPYAPFLLFITLSYYFFLRAAVENRGRWWVAYGVCLTLSFFTHMLTLHLAVTIAAFTFVLLVLKEPVPRSVFFRGAIATIVAGIAGATWTFTVPKLTGVIAGRYVYSPYRFLMSVATGLGTLPRNYYPDGSMQSILAQVFAVVFLVVVFLGLKSLVISGKRKVAWFAGLLFFISLSVLYVTLGHKGTWLWTRYCTQLLSPYLILFSIGFWYVRDRLSGKVWAFVLPACLLMLPSVGLEKWGRSAAVSRSKNFERWASQVQERETELKGVIGYDRHGYNRIIMNYFVVRRDRLPLYHLSSEGLFATSLGESLLGVTLVPYVESDNQVRLKTGRYALVSKETPSCDRLAAEDTSIHVTEVPSERDDYVTLCDVRGK